MHIKKGQYKKALFVSIIIALVATIVWIFISSSEFKEAEVIGNQVSSFQELSDRFATLAKEKGGEYAFEVLSLAKLPPQTDLHLLGHVVGDELYKQQGIDGIQTCTQEFRNACSHTIVIGTLAEFGEGALPRIRDACAEAPGGSGAYTMCFHGLGHGVLSGFGYDLSKTGEFCKLTGTEEYGNQEAIECFGGAVMELTGGGGAEPILWKKAREKYLSGSPVDLCLSDAIPEEFQSICLTYITPQIWEAVGINLGAPEEKKFTEAFALCDTIAKDKSNLRESCYAGFGKEFIPLAGARDIRDISNYSDSDFARAINWCLYAGSDEGKQWCVNEGLDSVFWGGENDTDASFRYCSVVGEVTGDEYKNSCEENLARNISFYIKDTKKQLLCEALPEKFQEQCLQND